MVLKKFMAKLGKGAAQVDLILDKEEYHLGETIQGELVIQGGTIEQDINKIDIDLFASIRVKEHEHTQLVQRFPFHTKFQIQPSERKTFPFSYELPKNLLLSGYSVSYYFVTHLDIAGGVDSTDRDPIIVTAPARFQNVLTALAQLGFQEKYGSRSFDGYMQEFEFTPTSFLKGQVKEIEFVAILEEEGIRLLLEVDLPTLMGEKEIKREVWIENHLLDDLSQLISFLQQVLTEMIQNPTHYAHPPKHFYHHDHHKLSGLPGAIGAFAVGLMAAELFEDAIEDAVEEIFEEEGEQEENGGFDFFGGGEGED